MARVRSIDELRRQKIVVRPNSQCMPVHPVVDANAYVDLVSECERLSRELIELDSLAPGNKPDCEPHY